MDKRQYDVIMRVLAIIEKDLQSPKTVEDVIEDIKDEKPVTPFKTTYTCEDEDQVLEYLKERTLKVAEEIEHVDTDDNALGD